jgi:hypothetical protein
MSCGGIPLLNSIYFFNIFSFSLPNISISIQSSAFAYVPNTISLSLRATFHSCLLSSIPIINSNSFSIPAPPFHWCSLSFLPFFSFMRLSCIEQEIKDRLNNDKELKEKAK